MSNDIKRLSLNLSASAYAELRAIGEELGCTMTEVVRIGLGLAKTSVDEAKQGHKLLITSVSGKPLSEIVLPKSP